MSKILFTSVAVGVMAAAFGIGCGDAPANQLIGGGTDPSGTSSGDPAATGSSGSTGTQSGTSGSSGTTATSGGLSPVDASAPSNPPATTPPAGACLPPNVQAMFAAKCTGCHSDPPVNGSLSGLVTLADLMATSKEDPTKNEAQLSLARMQNAASPMPPGAPSPAADVATLQTWINAKYTSSACAPPGTPPPPPPGDMFTGSTFTSQTSGSTHNAGRDCMGGCHNHGFTFAGTLTNGAGAGVAGAEVRLVDASNKVISVYTGPNGNFHSSSSWAAPAKVGVRNASAKNIMVTALSASNGGCNGCHANGGVQVPIHLP